MNITEALNEGEKYLKDIKYSSSSKELRYILSHLLNKDISYLFAHSEQKLSPSIEKKYIEILNRRRRGEPLQYILGKTEFFGRDFIVNKNVLIPRQDTELSIEILLDIIKNNNIDSILDIGTGSGAVAITVNLESNINTTACDISKKALEVASDNAKLLHSNVLFIESNLFDNIDGTFDIIYSNPPYIERKEIDNLQVEVKNFEPRLALDGGIDGLYFYKNIIKKAPFFLNKDGYLIFEIGYNQGHELVKLMCKNFETKIYKDLNNLDRVIVGKMRS